MRTDFVLDALEQAPYARQSERNALVHHSDRGSQYVSIKYSERLAEAGIEPSVGDERPQGHIAIVPRNRWGSDLRCGNEIDGDGDGLLLVGA